MSVARVLCVENHPESMGALKYILEKAGYEVTPATTGDQALRLLTTLNVDGVLLEYDLQDATGSVLRAEMKRIKPYVPVLLFAGIGSQRVFGPSFRRVERLTGLRIPAADRAVDAAGEQRPTVREEVACPDRHEGPRCGTLP